MVNPLLSFDYLGVGGGNSRIFRDYLIEFIQECPCEIRILVMESRYLLKN